MMELLEKFFNLISKTPDWVYLYLVPALILGAAVGFVFAPRRRWYFCVAAVCTAGGFLMAFTKNKTLSVLYFIVVVAYCALLSLLFLIPRLQKRQKDVKKSRLDALYDKFHEELTEKSYAPRAAMPPKVCCFERGTEAGATAGEYGMNLSYADALLTKLRSKNLSAGDRLEAEELSRRLDFYRDKPLSEAERNTLNDCLAAILKLTAKYQL